MIERMTKVCIVAAAGKKDALLTELRELKLLHIAERVPADASLTDRFQRISKTMNELSEYRPKKQRSAEVLSDEGFRELDEKVTGALSEKAELTGKRSAELMEIERVTKWGDFDPEELRRFRKEGVSLRFYQLGKKEYEEFRSHEEIDYILLAAVDGLPVVAVLGDAVMPVQATEFQPPTRSLSELKQAVAGDEKKIGECESLLTESSQYTGSYKAQLVKLQNEIEYSGAERTASEEEGLTWLSGYLPTADFGTFKKAAAENSWAYLAEDVVEDDGEVPTKVRYTKLTGLMKPVFDILGTVPGYNEYDISLWFLMFFTLFFAMIVGDAAYGVLFLAGAVALHVKTKKLSDANLLLYVLSVATIAWGSVTGTWFGLEGAMKIPLLKSLVIPEIANYPEYFNVTTTAAQNNVMKFCFSIGIVQLALACIMNIRKKLRAHDLSWVSDLCWLVSLCALYVLVLYLVIGQNANLGIVAAIVIVCFLGVICFGGQEPGKSFSEGLKAGLGGAFTTFLDTISAFGNVMSYIRLFAVGMSSLAIAQSFNNMASGFTGILVFVAALIMIFGHVLNIIMAFLSVAVHGVRLNLLEFSGQLGMEWSGTEYDPFRKMDKVRK